MPAVLALGRLGGGLRAPEQEHKLSVRQEGRKMGVRERLNRSEDLQVSA